MMNHTVGKLIATAMALIMSVVMIVTISYAWMTLSSAPMAEGVQITIGGGSTILIAPDLTSTVDGETYHYPGYFKDTLNFTRYEEYSYLTELDSLSPVSTADGIHWFIPTYYDVSDEEVKNGKASVGDIKPIDSFHRDTELNYANLIGEDSSKGHYMYLDFWIVSPATNYTLRVSRGDESNGSYLVELPNPTEQDEGYVLAQSGGQIAASARIGFLANTDYVTDQTMVYYQQSDSYAQQYHRLCGIYHDKGELSFPGNYRFTIYEPNGDLHPGEEYSGYYPTSPLGWDGQKVFFADVRDRLTVQLQSKWHSDRTEGLTLDEALQVATIGKNITSAADAWVALYESYLQGQFMPYMTSGQFISDTVSLYGYCSDDQYASTEELDALNLAGATDDTYIVELEKNVPQKIRMFVWIEGQDLDCTALSGSQPFALSIELAGSN